MTMMITWRIKERMRYIRIDIDPNFLGIDDNCIVAIVAGDDTGKRSRALKRLLRRVIDGELTMEQKRVFYLYYYKQINMKEIAEMVGTSNQAVSAMLLRATKRIKKVMKYFF